MLALSTTVFGQGTGFVTAGTDRLRSKSLDRNSFNSGDWFNQIRWDCADGNGFGEGLPPAADNQDKWSYAKPLLADPALVPDCTAIHLAAARFEELLRIRQLAGFALGTAPRCSSGCRSRCRAPSATPGRDHDALDARGLDPHYALRRSWSSTPARPPPTQTVTALKGADVALHPVLRGSADPALRRPRSTGDGHLHRPGARGGGLRPELNP